MNFTLRSAFLEEKKCKPNSKSCKTRARTHYENHLFLKHTWEEFSLSLQPWASSHLKSEEQHLDALPLGASHKQYQSNIKMERPHFKQIINFNADCTNKLCNILSHTRDPSTSSKLIHGFKHHLSSTVPHPFLHCPFFQKIHLSHEDL